MKSELNNYIVKLCKEYIINNLLKISNANLNPFSISFEKSNNALLMKKLFENIDT
jgi:hypothetical protein